MATEGSAATAGSRPPGGAEQLVAAGPGALRMVAVASIAGSPGCAEIAFGLAAATAALGRPAIVALPGEGRRAPSPTLMSSPPARRLESAAREAGLEAAARGRVAAVVLTERESDAVARLAAQLGELVDEAGETLGASSPAVAYVALDAAGFREACFGSPVSAHAAALCCRLPAQRAPAALAVDALRTAGVEPRLAIHRLGRLASRRVRAGLEPGGSAGEWLRRLARGLAGEQGQALPLGAGLALALTIAAVLLAVVGASLNAAARVQRAADLAAVTAARSLRDDVPRLTAPRRLAGGRPNPVRLERAEVVARARSRALEVARRNGLERAAVKVMVPREAVPLMARVEVRGELRASDSGRSPGPGAGPVAVAAVAVAAATPPGSAAQPAMAAGGGYSGPLAYRQGKPMRPDVAGAFDRMAAAASRAGHGLLVVSGFRSDAEQAVLFAQNPDPRWVAPPGQSLHRCATELDIGPRAAYAWLAANAGRFGFLRRYSWEPWHFGYVRGPQPCSPQGNAAGSAGGADGRPARGARRGGSGAGGSAVPAYVPAAYRGTLAREASRNAVSPALLGAQLMAESNFDPRAVSPAGARGIAQFMPATALEWGLRDPFDPHASIAAQARLMAHLISSFGRVDLALAAYNAGPGAVSGCNCIPPYAETQAYVAKILALAGSGGDHLAPVEVRLVASSEWWAGGDRR